MNLAELKTFLSIVHTGSLVNASKQLHVTQSTVTARLQSLEQELGQKLINRDKSGVSLTGAGERLQRYANTIDQLWQQAKQETSLPENVQSICNIGCHPDLWPGMGQKLFNKLHALYPSMAISIWQGGQLELENWTRSGLIDISLTYWATGSGKRTVHSLSDDELVLYSTNPKSPIKFDPGYVYIEAGQQFEQEHAAAYADADTAKLNFGTATLGLEYILNKSGSAYLPKRIASPYLAAKQLHEIAKAPKFKRKVYLVLSEEQQESLDILGLLKTL